MLRELICQCNSFCGKYRWRINNNLFKIIKAIDLNLSTYMKNTISPKKQNLLFQSMLLINVGETQVIFCKAYCIFIKKVKGEKCISII
jgi:hypothetical protein